MTDPATQDSSILEGDLYIGDFVFRPLLKTVRPSSSPKGTGEVRLPDKAVEVLIYLAARQRDVCDRDEILDAVWGTERDAFDRVLDNAIREIRRAFGDDARTSTYIQTIPRRGYRLIAPVSIRKLRPSLPEDPPVPEVDSEPWSGEPFVDPWDGLDREEASEEGRESERETSENSTAPTETVAPATKNARRWRRPLAGISLVIVLAIVAWLLPSSRGRGIQLEVRPATPEAEGDVELAKTVRDSLFGSHPCRDESLVMPVAGISRSDMTLTVGIDHTDGRTMLKARASDPSVAAVLARVDERDLEDVEKIRQFLTDVSAMVDRQICFESDLPEERQACHCKAASTRTFHKMSAPAPHIELLEQAIALDPSDADSYEALAAVYRSIGDNDAAGDTLSAGLAQIDDPTSVPALTLRRRLAETLGDFPTEARLIEKLRSFRPEEPRWILAEAAFSARHRRDCAQAMALISSLGGQQIPPEATRLEDSESVWTCLLHSDRQEEARQRLEQRPLDAGTRFQLALGFVLAGRLEEARHLANEYLALQPASADAYWLLASLEGRQGAYSAARHWLDEMKERIEWPNQDLRYRTSAGWTDLRDRRATECIERFTDMPEGSRPWSVMARWTLGRCQVQAGDPPAAHETLRNLREELTAAQTSWQEEFVLHLEASLIAAETDDPEAMLHAAELMVRATELGPSDYPYFATEAGILLERAGDLERAQEFYERAVAYSPSYPWSNCRLGLLLQRLGRKDDAVEHLHQALEVFGNPPEGPVGMKCAEALAELDPTFEVARR